jgi:LPS-assembly lipoprotein
MSWRDRMFGRGIGIAILALPLAGCLQPLYGSLSANGNVAEQLQAIAVDPIPERIGHYMGDELIFNLNGTGSHVPPRYRLHVVLREGVQTPVIDTVSGQASSGTVVLNADYQLVPVGSTTPIAKGSVSVAADYDRTSQRFANVRAARDAEIRDAKRLADLVQTRIAAVFAGQGPGGS